MSESWEDSLGEKGQVQVQNTWNGKSAEMGRSYNRRFLGSQKQGCPSSLSCLELNPLLQQSQPQYFMMQVLGPLLRGWFFFYPRLYSSTLEGRVLEMLILELSLTVWPTENHLTSLGSSFTTLKMITFSPIPPLQDLVWLSKLFCFSYISSHTQNSIT